MKALAIKKMLIKIEKFTFTHHDAIQGDSFKLNHSIKKEVFSSENNRHTLKLHFNVENTNENPFPIDLEVIIKADFIIENSLHEDISSFLNFQAVQILYPYLRSAVANLTATAMVPSINLPLVNPNIIETK